MATGIPSAIEEQIARAQVKGDSMTTSDLLEAVSKQLEPLEESDEEDIPAHMTRAQLLPPKADYARRDRSPSTDYDEK
jgi:hypothetical protein